MKKILYLLIFFAASCAAQNNIKKTAGINYTDGPPTFFPNENSGSEFAIDTITGRLWQWHRDPGPTAMGDWVIIGQGIDMTTGGTPPAYAPVRNQSWFAINADDELYHYSGVGTTWNLVSGGGGSIITDATLTGTGVAGDTLRIAQQGAVSGDVLKWNGTTWEPGADGGNTYTEGYGVNIGADEISVDTTQIPTSFGAASVYRLWPKGNVNSYQAASTKRNWIIYNNNVQAASARNAFMKFDTISYSGVGSTTNISGNGIWMATSTSVADMVSGFSNNIQHGGGFNMFGSGNINFSDWRSSGTRGSVLKAFNWTSGGGGDVAISFFRSQSTDVTNGLTQLGAGEEIAAIRFSAADTTRALTSTNTFLYPLPCAAIVGYTFKKQWNNAHYGGIGIWTTNGSTTQFRAVAVDSTFSTTVRAGIGVVPSPDNTLQVAGQTSISGNLALSTAGNKISIATGTNASVGTATLVGGTITISTTAVTANSIIICNHVTPIVTQGILSVPAASIVPGVSFTINSDSVADASSINWWIIN